MASLHIAEERRSLMQDDASVAIASINDIEIRHGFIRKVYGILSCQLILTTAIGAVIVVKFEEYMRNYPHLFVGVLFLTTFGTVALTCIMVCFPKTMRTTPTNYILLFAFTACEGVLVGCVCIQYTFQSVIIAAGMTAFLVVSLTIFAFQTSIDFTGFGPYLFAASMCFAMFGFSLWIASFAGLKGQAFETLNLMYCCCGALLFCFFFIFDTQMIVGGKHKLSFSIDDYCPAALSLYMDIVQMFLFLLRIFGERR